MLKTREVLTDGLEVDSALAKPIDLQETRDLIDLLHPRAAAQAGA